jgi:trehalose-phosphatase
VGLDFDGTLAEIAATPAQASLSAQTRRLLRLLCLRPDTRIAILSGRSLRDVRRLVRFRGIYYAGNHGLEIRGPGIRWSHPQARAAGRALWRSLESGLRKFPGAFIEDKRLGAAVHYRGVAPRHLRRLKEGIRNWLRGPGDGFRMLDGKKTFDLRPALSWDKGRALELIRKRLKGRPGWTAVFVGDDATDEEAFRTIGPRALTVRVGRIKTTAADFVLPRRQWVDRLLEILARRSGSAPGMQAAG